MKIPSSIVEVPGSENGWFWVIKADEDGRLFHLRGPGAPKEGKPGDRGTVEYHSGRSYGIYCWTKTV